MVNTWHDAHLEVRKQSWASVLTVHFEAGLLLFWFSSPLSTPEWLLGILAPPQEVTRITDTHAGFLYGFWGLKLKSPHLCWKWFYSLSYLPVSMALNWQIQLDVFHTKQPMVAQVDLWPSSVTYCVAPADLEVMAVLLPHPPECWNYRHKTPAYFEEEVLTHGRMVRSH